MTPPDLRLLFPNLCTLKLFAECGFKDNGQVILFGCYPDLKTATRLLLLIIDSDSARAEQVATNLRLGGTAVHMDRYDSIGQVPTPCELYDLCFISLEHRETLKGVGIKQLRELDQDCPVLALGQPNCQCSLGNILAHGFSDWVGVDDLLHLREVAKREGERLASHRHTSLLRSALLNSENRAEQVMQDAREPHAIIVDGAHARTNRSYLKLLGMTNHDEAIRTPFLDLVDGSDCDKARVLLRGYAREKSTTRQVRLSLKRIDGLVLNATLTLSPYVTDDERGLLLTVRSLAQLPPATRPQAIRLPGQQHTPEQQGLEQKQARTMIDKAMRQNALKLQFQPLHNASDDTDQQTLVQLRPRDTKQNLPTDMQLVRLAAKAGTTQSLDRWLLFSAAREAQRLFLENTRLHIPISARAITDTGLLGWLRQLLGQVAHSGISLVLSLNIEDCREHSLACEKFAPAVRAMGCGISLCDAFKDSNDLELLKTLKPDYVQLHPAVLSSFNNQQFSAKNLRRLTQLIQSAGAEVICPALEKSISPQRLAALGVNLSTVDEKSETVEN